ncbi:MAG: hypothetical protein ACJAQT_004810 [Akkermansiaceae bacterium]|jgi:hypothetical protein
MKARVRKSFIKEKDTDFRNASNPVFIGCRQSQFMGARKLVDVAGVTPRGFLRWFCREVERPLRGGRRWTQVRLSWFIAVFFTLRSLGLSLPVITLTPPIIDGDLKIINHLDDD